MANFSIKPRRYNDRLDAIWAFLDSAQDKGRVVDLDRNPNGKLEMLAWAHDEIIRLRQLVEEKKVERSRISDVSPLPRLSVEPASPSPDSAD